MRVTSLRFFPLLILVFVIAGQSHAAQWYVRGGMGYEWSHDADFHDDDPGSTDPPALFGQGPGRDGRHLGARGDFGGFPVFEIAVGAQPLSWLRTDLSLTYRPDMDYEGQANFLHVTGPQPVTGEAKSWTTMANLFIELTELAHVDLGVFTPYVGGGIGLSHNRIGRMTYRFPELTRHKISITPSGSRTDFAYMVAVGTGIRVAKKVVLDVSYRYSDLGRVETDRGNMYMDSLPSGIDIASTSAPLRTQGLMVTFRYLF
jgi:opacity protein-like surface antigen